MLSVLSAAALFWTVCLAAAAGKPVAFKTLEHGQQSRIETARQPVIRTPAEWTALWKAHAPDRPRPAVDFEHSTIVGVFAGSRPTGGHAVEITRIDREGPTLVVHYRERKPAPSDIVTQMITTPYHLVSIPRFEGPVRFTNR